MTGTKTLGEVIVERRKEQRLNQDDLAARVGVNVATIRRLEKNQTRQIRPGTKTKLERALSWSAGAVDRILNGHPTDADLDPNQRFGYVSSTLSGSDSLTVGGPRDHAPADDSAAATVHAKAGGASGRGVGGATGWRKVGTVDDLTRMVAQISGILASTPLRTDAEEGALRALSVLLAERLPPLPPDPEDEEDARP